MTSTSLPTYLHSIWYSLTVKGFPQTQASMSFSHVNKTFFFLYSFNILLTDFLDVVSSNSHCIILGSPLNNLFLLKLIINNFDFFFCWIFELFSKHWVSGSNCDGRSIKFRINAGNVMSNFHHCGIADLWIALNLKFSIFRNRNKPSKHILLWNTNFFHYQVSVVFCCKTDLGSNVTDLYSRQRISILISNRNNERMNAFLLTFQDHFGKHQSMSTEDPHFSGPILCCFDWRSINNELVLFLVVCGCG